MALGYPANNYYSYGTSNIRGYPAGWGTPTPVMPSNAPTRPARVPNPRPTGSASTYSAVANPPGRPSPQNPRVASTPRAPAPVPPPVYLTIQSEVTDEFYVLRMAEDDGNGKIVPVENDTGTVNYVTGEIIFPPEMAFHTKSWSSSRTNGTGEWNSSSTSDTYDGVITVKYRPDIVGPTAYSETLDPPSLVFSLTPYTADTIVPGTVRFTIGSTVYEDNEGVIQHTVNPVTGVGTVAGTIDYGSGDVELTDWVAGNFTFSIQSMALYRGPFTETEFYYRTAGSPLRSNSFQIACVALDGELLDGSADVNGVISGDNVEGYLDVTYGLVAVRFGEYVLDADLTLEEKAEEWYDPLDVDEFGYIWRPRQIIPNTTRYNAVVYSYLPLSSELLGLNPVRLPMDGRVPIVRPGDSVAIHNTGTIEMPLPPQLTGGYVEDCGRTRLSRVWIRDAEGTKVSEAKYTADLDAGTVTLVPGFTLDSYVLPLTLYHMIVDEALVMDVDVSGSIAIARPVTHDYPEDTSYLSSEWRIGDMFARVTAIFSQSTWTSVWEDTVIGTPPTAQFNNSSYPIVVTNDGAVHERWRINFITSTSVNVIGETFGQINTSPLLITDVIAPVNPVTELPYFTIPIEGWGSGWLPNNQLRFNTISADYPLSLLRCVQQGPASGDADRLSLEFLGDVDA